MRLTTFVSVLALAIVAEARSLPLEDVYRYTPRGLNSTGSYNSTSNNATHTKTTESSAHHTTTLSPSQSSEIFKPHVVPEQIWGPAEIPSGVGALSQARQNGMFEVQESNEEGNSGTAGLSFLSNAKIYISTLG